MTVPSREKFNNRARCDRNDRAPLLPNAKRNRVAFEKNAALGALPGLMPFANAVTRRHRASRFEAKPADAFGPARRETVQRGLNCRRPGGSFDRVETAGSQLPTSQGRIGGNGDFQFGHGIMEFLAVATHNRLDGQVNPAVRAARYLGAITTFRTFKKVSAAHFVI